MICTTLPYLGYHVQRLGDAESRKAAFTPGTIDQAKIILTKENKDH